MRIAKFAIPVLIVAAIGFVPFIHYNTMETISADVTEKYVKRKSDSDEYRIATRSTNDTNQVEVFKNVDSILSFKFNSADVNARIAVGDTCTLRVNGFRVPWLSMFRNVIEVKECRA
jgi:heme/copper-type cytochrome/quinol oxidase subunit 2